MLVVKNTHSFVARDINMFFREHTDIWQQLKSGQEVEISAEDYEFIKAFVKPRPSKGAKFIKKTEITAQSIEQNIKD